MKIEYHGDDETTLAKALRRLRLLEADSPVPRPFQRATGVAGKSRVYFLFIPKGVSGVSLVAKFDEPARAKREWDAIEELRSLNIPLQAMLPILDNRFEDGVVLYRDVSGATATGLIWQTKELFRRQLLGNHANCLEALRSAFKVLDHFYRDEPGAARLTSEGTVLRWADSYPTLAAELPELRELVKPIWPNLDWQAKMFAPPGCGGPGRSELPNPFYFAESRLEELTGRVMLSRVHGDLNLSNILVGLDGSRKAVDVFIIDLSHCTKGSVTAKDFARMESEFWHEVFVPLMQDGGAAVRNAPALFTDIIDYLDADTVAHLHVRGYTGPVPGARIGDSCVQIIRYLRSHAEESLRGGVANYRLYDYFACLYFTHLSSLRYESVSKSPEKAKVAVLGAALALRFLLNVDSGMLVEGAEQVRTPNNPMVQDPKAMAPDWSVPNPQSTALVLNGLLKARAA